MGGYNSLFTAMTYRTPFMSVSGTQATLAASAAKLPVVMAQLDFLVGDIPGNTQLIIEATRRASAEHQADIVVFPELCLTGYPPEEICARAVTLGANLIVLGRQGKSDLEEFLLGTVSKDVASAADCDVLLTT